MQLLCPMQIDDFIRIATIVGGVVDVVDVGQLNTNGQNV